MVIDVGGMKLTDIDLLTNELNNELTAKMFWERRRDNAAAWRRSARRVRKLRHELNRRRAL